MVVDEQSRYALTQRLAEVLGHEEAIVLMEHLPPAGWSEMATKTDLAHLGDQLRAEMAVLRSDLRTEMADLHRGWPTCAPSSGAPSPEFQHEFHADRRAAQRQMIFVLVVALVSLVVNLAG